MRVTVKTTNLTLTPAIATFLAQRVDAITKLLARAEARTRAAGKTFSHTTVAGRIELGRTTRHHQKGDVFRAEMMLDVPGRKTLRAEATADDLRVAIITMNIKYIPLITF